MPSGNKSFIDRYLTEGPIPVGLIKVFSGINVPAYKISGGRLFGEIDGTQVCLVTMTGRKSGKRRTIPLMYTAHGDDVLLVASLRGSDKHPAWYYNLRANPDVEIQVGREKRRMRARQASAQEKQDLWPVLTDSFESYSAYQQKTDRDIPVMICSPA